VGQFESSIENSTCSISQLYGRLHYFRVDGKPGETEWLEGRTGDHFCHADY
jgi:hypothetical protein